jgi:hypothetical protein
MYIYVYNYPFNEIYATLIPALLAGNIVIMKVYIFTYMYIYIYVCIYRYICICIYIHIYVYIYIHIYIYIYLYIYICIYIYIYIYRSLLSAVLPICLLWKLSLLLFLQVLSILFLAGAGKRCRRL